MTKGYNHTLVSLFDSVVARYHDRIILQFEQINISNFFLEYKSVQIASVLQKYVTRPEQIVPLIVDRSPYTAIGLFAILKTGAAFLLIEPNDPLERINYILQQTNSRVIITQSHYVNKFNNFLGTVIVIDKDINSFHRSELIFKDKIQADNIACIVYTSGTTGIPKGICITHRSIINRLIWMWDNYPFETNDIAIQKTSVNFVDFICELLGPILQGIRVFIFRDLITEYMKLSYAIKKHYITNLVIVPSVLEQFIYSGYMDFLSHLKILHVSGEKISIKSLNKIRSYNKNLKILNLYGSSEVTADATYYEIGSQMVQSYLIGKPINNTEVFVLDNDLNKTLPGKRGNIYVSGICLARGYVSNSHLTAEKFIANPFFKKNQPKSFLRMYHTGDEGIMLPSGNIEFLGRSDSQIKIRGQRIELQEIERVIEMYPGVKQCIVVLREKNDNKYLVAYYTKNINFIHNDASDYVNNWHSLYQNEYSLLNINNKDHDIGLWRSSYNGQPIPRDEMVEWVDSTVSRISSLNPKVILEIGCGSGLILSKLIEQCEYYYATDFSEKSIEYVKQLSRDMGKFNSINALVCNADSIPFDKFKSKVDTVVINSVVQYFPNLRYLDSIIGEVINNISPSGKIFIGDVRDYRLIECFHHSVIKYKNLSSDKSKIEYFVDREKELLISPEYFYFLKQLKGISNIEIMPRTGIFNNEMNNYRYDVIIHVQKDKNNSYNELIHIDVNLFKKVINFEQYFSSNKGKEYIYITYPNKRIYKDFINCSRLLGKHCDYDYDQLLSIEEIENITSKEKYRSKIFLDLDNPLNLHVVLYYSRNCIKYFDLHYSRKVNISALSNNPIEDIKLLDSSFVKNLQNFLKTKLTEAMLPLYYVPIKKIPVTINGKVDKKALVDPVLNNNASYISPRNFIEAQVCKICAVILGLSEDLVSIMDDFFRLGGNSILAIKFSNELSKKLDVNITVSKILECKTLDVIARFINEELSSVSEVIEEGTL